MVSPPDQSSQRRSAKSAERKGRAVPDKPARRAPLDADSLRDLALSYAARYATTAAKLEAYLARKIRERGVAEDGDGRSVELDVGGLIARLVELGYVDDDAFARARSRDLTARGYGARRVEQALWAAGVDEQAREDHAPGEAQRRRAAMLLAKKRRFGPYALSEAAEAAGEAAPSIEPARREKQIAAMLRAGHDYEHVRKVIEAPSRVELEDWLAEAQAEEEENSR
ncbi:regulatory protein RecX [Erythrobacter sp.]|uniref:regulatory protein RecX n=1 Tax=Erythrobacter sp. TaxID=1042 RepID=UPI001425CF5B|nr:regulatory protein RecX [Erythrobacter sp.]QIQ87060.1 MAG: RecX family transcriptional regulator [Erythrobacter sp.]